MPYLNLKALHKITCIEERAATHDYCIFPALPCTALKINMSSPSNMLYTYNIQHTTKLQIHHYSLGHI